MAVAESLDEYLERGYFRAGHTLRQTNFVYVEGEMYSTIWSRVPLQTYMLSKSQRRLLRQVRARYEVKIGPYRASRDQDELYERYQTSHPLDVGESIADIFGYHHPVIEFRTYLLRIELNGRLVAFSCFDRGVRTMASLFGCYEPMLARESLGFATMLLELEFGRERHLTHYYPGYCVPGLAPFAYKLRLPSLEGLTYRRPTWNPMAEVLSRPLPKEELLAIFSHLANCLTESGVASRLLIMPLADNLPNVHATRGPMPYSLMLSVASGVPLGETLVGYDLVRGSYEMWLAAPDVDLAEDEFMSGLFDDFPVGSDLRLFGWRIPIYATAEVSQLLRYLSPGKLIGRILRGEG